MMVGRAKARTRILAAFLGAACYVAATRFVSKLLRGSR